MDEIEAPASSPYAATFDENSMFPSDGGGGGGGMGSADLDVVEGGGGFGSGGKLQSLESLESLAAKAEAAGAAGGSSPVQTLSSWNDGQVAFKERGVSPLRRLTFELLERAVLFQAGETLVAGLQDKAQSKGDEQAAQDAQYLRRFLDEWRPALRGQGFAGQSVSQSVSQFVRSFVRSFARSLVRPFIRSLARSLGG